MVATAGTAGRSAGAAGRRLSVAAAERWFLRAGAFLLPLAYVPDTYDGYVLPKLLIARVLLFGLAALWLAKLAESGVLTVRRTALDLPVAAMLLSAAISTVFAYNVNVAVFGTYSRYDGLLTSVTYAGLFWLAVQTLHSRSEAVLLLRTMLASGYVAAIVAIVQAMIDSINSGQLAPAFGTLGQKNSLGAFLALLIPLACWELIRARGWTARILALNVFVVMTLALLLSFSRSAWIAGAGATFAVAIAVMHGTGRRIALVATVALIAAAAALLAAGSGVAIERRDLLQVGDRPVVWVDTLRLIATRPLVGYGPDNFGLVYPAFQSRDLHQPWDKAHAEVLQIAATQGIVGVGAYLWLLTAAVRSFIKSGLTPLVWAVLGAFTGYELTLQVNFTALAAAFPFWIFLAAAMVGVARTHETSTIPIRARWVAAAAVPVSLAACAPATVLPYLADTQLRAAVAADFAGRSGDAILPARNAVALAPYESVYATEAGNIAFERSDWKAARTAYRAAATLGTFSPAVYRNLALSDLQLGLFNEAREAAQRAYGLDRFDPANRALLADLGGMP